MDSVFSHIWKRAFFLFMTVTWSCVFALPKSPGDEGKSWSRERLGGEGEGEEG